MQEKSKEYNKDLAIILRNKFLAGDDKAYADLYNLFAKELYAYGLFICNNKRITEDALQDVFTTLFANRNLLANVENVRYYFNSSFRNRIHYLLKKEGKKYDIEDNIIENLPDINSINIQEELIQNEETNQKETLVKKIFESLNDNQREVLYKRFIEGQSLDEIAATMHINYQSVKNLIQRSLTKIKNSEIAHYISFSIIFFELLSHLNL